MPVIDKYLHKQKLNNSSDIESEIQNNFMGKKYEQYQHDITMKQNIKLLAKKITFKTTFDESSQSPEFQILQNIQTTNNVSNENQNQRQSVQIEIKDKNIRQSQIQNKVIDNQWNTNRERERFFQITSKKSKKSEQKEKRSKVKQNFDLVMINLSYKKQLEISLQNQYDSIESITQDQTLVVKKNEVILYNQMEPIIREQIDLKANFCISQIQKIPSSNTLVKTFHNLTDKKLYIMVLDLEKRNIQFKFVEEVFSFLTYINRIDHLFLIIVVNIDHVNIGFFKIDDRTQQQYLKPVLVKKYNQWIKNIQKTDKCLLINHVKQVVIEELRLICFEINNQNLKKYNNNDLIMIVNNEEFNESTKISKVIKNNQSFLRKVELRDYSSDEDNQENNQVLISQNRNQQSSHHFENISLNKKNKKQKNSINQLNQCQIDKLKNKVNKQLKLQNKIKDHSDTPSTKASHNQIFSSPCSNSSQQQEFLSSTKTPDLKEYDHEIIKEISQNSSTTQLDQMCQEIVNPIQKKTQKSKEKIKNSVDSQKNQYKKYQEKIEKFSQNKIITEKIKSQNVDSELIPHNKKQISNLIKEQRISDFQQYFEENQILEEKDQNQLSNFHENISHSVSEQMNVEQTPQILNEQLFQEDDEFFPDSPLLKPQKHEHSKKPKNILNQQQISSKQKQQLKNANDYSDMSQHLKENRNKQKSKKIKAKSKYNEQIYQFEKSKAQEEVKQDNKNQKQNVTQQLQKVQTKYEYQNQEKINEIQNNLSQKQTEQQQQELNEYFINSNQQKQEINKYTKSSKKVHASNQQKYLNKEQQELIKEHFDQNKLIKDQTQQYKKTTKPQVNSCVDIYFDERNDESGQTNYSQQSNNKELTKDKQRYIHMKQQEEYDIKQNRSSIKSEFHESDQNQYNKHMKQKQRNNKLKYTDNQMDDYQQINNETTNVSFNENNQYENYNQMSDEDQQSNLFCDEEEYKCNDNSMESENIQQENTFSQNNFDSYNKKSKEELIYKNKMRREEMNQQYFDGMSIMQQNMPLNQQEILEQLMLFSDQIYYNDLYQQQNNDISELNNSYDIE